MLITLAGDELVGNQILLLRKFLVHSLKAGTEDVGNYGDSFDVLLALPELIQDPEIYSLVVQSLLCRALGYRKLAARVLHKIGDPLGILHLTYNSLGTHPVLGIDQRNISGRSDIVMRYSTDLPDECIDLLVKDMKGERPVFHGDALSQLPPEQIVDRVRPLLKEEGVTSRFAAYILAIKGDPEGFDVLEQWLINDTYPLLPIMALGRTPFPKAKSLAEEYANPDNPLYSKSDQSSTNKRWILPVAQLTSELLNDNNPLHTTRVMKKHYFETIEEIKLYNPTSPTSDLVTLKLKQPIDFFVRRNLDAPHTLQGPTILAKYASKQDIEFCLAIQKQSIKELFEMNEVGFFNLIDGNTCPFFLPSVLPKTGFETYYSATRYRCIPSLYINLEVQDYILAATDWIHRPELWQEVG